MKAAVLEEINAPLGIRDVELTELKVGQVLVKILVSGLFGHMSTRHIRACSHLSY